MSTEISEFEHRLIYQNARREKSEKKRGLWSLTHCGGCGAELIEGLDPEDDFILCDDCTPCLGKGWQSKSAWSWNCLHDHGPTEFCSDCIRRWGSPVPDRPSYSKRSRSLD